MEQPQEPTVLDSPEDVLSTLDKDGKRRWMYPIMSKGAFWRRRMAVGYGLIALFVGLPLVKIGEKPAMLLDIMHREFSFFGLTLYATDTLLLMLALITIFLAIVFATALLGRVWCGWGCPQTVYLEFVFRPIEELLEGKGNKRKRQDDAELTVDLALRKIAKHLIFLVISLGLAHTFVAYFVGWDQLITWMTGPPTEHWGFFVTMALTTALVMADFAWFREQMCTIACPYARLQSVLMDRDSLIVSYDPGRGEPRGKQKRGGQDQGLGDCIDCGACVRTCPTGIDIRDGLQMECVSCTQCVDACDEIMERIGKPGGLVRYTSENALEKKNPRVVRPRTIFYAAGLTAMIAVFTVALLGREAVDINITRVPGAPFTVLPDGKIANRLRFRVQNRVGQPDTFTIEAVKPEGVEIKVIGVPELKLDNGQMTHIDAWVVIPPEAFLGSSTVGHFQINGGLGEHSKVVQFKLQAPTGQGQGG